MPKYSTKIISDSGVLVVAMMLSNALNFVFNSYLGRVLSFEEFGLVSLVNTFLFIATMFLGAFGNTITHSVSFLSSKSGTQVARRFFIHTRKVAVVVVVLISLFWILLSGYIAHIFQILDSSVVLFFSPTFLLLVVAIAGRSYLQGVFSFGSVALLYLCESVSKLVAVFLFVTMGYPSLAYLAIPISVFITTIVCGIILFGQFRISDSEQAEGSYTFPFSFYFASVFNGIVATVFLSIDVLLAKHFLPPSLAGEYALLSLVGKMVFFLGSLFNSFMNTFISRDLGKGHSPRPTFYMLFATSAFFSLNAFALFGPLGYITVPLLFGPKTAAILPYLTFYALGIALFTLSNTIVTYRTLLHQYLFPVLSLGIAVCMFIGILYSHSSVEDIARVVTIAGAAGFMLISIMHVLYDQGRYILRNLIDLFDLFSPVGNESDTQVYTKRILIFNWRDIKHVRAGGAEVYVHELAKRWVTEGCKVTMFCGNDGKNARYESVDGVEVVRRGGFYFVYIWAFLYYIFKFRGKYDVIVDCENGVPFFTPLYTKERQYLVIMHVHQEVFRKILPGVIGEFAVFLETRVMPYVYQNVPVIAISPSTRDTIIEAGLTKEEVSIVHCGIDTQVYSPAGKDTDPTILYLGRLKSYKSVDVFIKAAKQVLQKIPSAKFIIAGDGEERKNLETLASRLGISKSIHFLGKVSDEMKVKLYQSAWVFVNPSFREGWGITTIEANACGTPVVASRVPGLIDSVKNPHTGYLVDYGSVGEFSSRITELLEDSSLRSTMSGHAIEWANEFSWDSSAHKALEVLFPTYEK